MQFFFQTDAFPSIQGVVLVFQWLVLLEEKSPFPSLGRAEWNLCWSSNLRGKGGINSWSEDRVYLKLIVFLRKKPPTSRSSTWYPFVFMSCAPTSESFSSLISGVLCWLGVIKVQAGWLIKKSCLWDQRSSTLPKRFFWELTVIPLTKFSTVGITESGSKSRDHSIPFL